MIYPDHPHNCLMRTAMVKFPHGRAVVKLLRWRLLKNLQPMPMKYHLNMVAFYKVYTCTVPHM